VLLVSLDLQKTPLHSDGRCYQVQNWPESKGSLKDEYFAANDTENPRNFRIMSRVLQHRKHFKSRIEKMVLDDYPEARAHNIYIGRGSIYFWYKHCEYFVITAISDPLDKMNNLIGDSSNSKMFKQNAMS